MSPFWARSTRRPIPAALRRRARRALRRARRYSTAGRYLDASTAWGQAWSAQPHRARWAAAAAEAALHGDDAAAALTWSRKALWLDASTARHHRLLGDALHAQGRCFEAELAWLRALTLQPGDNDVRAKLQRLHQPMMPAAE
ncbi:MAG: hypothetical protein ACPGUV_15465 [Polyangiales bacterium]